MSIIGLFFVVSIIISLFENHYIARIRIRELRTRTQARMGIVAAFILTAGPGETHMSERLFRTIIPMYEGLFEMSTKLRRRLTLLQFVHTIEQMLSHGMSLGHDGVVEHAFMEREEKKRLKEAAKQVGRGVHSRIEKAEGGGDSTSADVTHDMSEEEAFKQQRWLFGGLAYKNPRIGKKKSSTRNLAQRRTTSAIHQRPSMAAIHQSMTEEDGDGERIQRQRSSAVAEGEGGANEGVAGGYHHGNCWQRTVRQWNHSRARKNVSSYLKGHLHNSLVSMLFLVHVGVVVLYGTAYHSREDSWPQVKKNDLIYLLGGNNVDNGYRNLDYISSGIVAFWAFEVGVRIVIDGWQAYWHRPSRFFAQMKNRLDVMVLVVAVVIWGFSKLSSSSGESVFSWFIGWKDVLDAVQPPSFSSALPAVSSKAAGGSVSSNATAATAAAAAAAAAATSTAAAAAASNNSTASTASTASTSSTSSWMNDSGRAGLLVIPLFRIFNEVPAIRRIFFTLIAVLPYHVDVAKAITCVLYLFSCVGVLMFSGEFKTFMVTEYEFQQANFDSITSSFFTLWQLFVGEGSDAIIYATIDSSGSWFAIFFVLYIVIMTLLFTNLILSVILDGFARGYEELKHLPDKKISERDIKEVREGRDEMVRMQGVLIFCALFCATC